MKRLFIVLLIGTVFIIGSSGLTIASLIGDFVESCHRYPTKFTDPDDCPGCGYDNDTVTADATDLMCPYNGYTVDVNADYIYIGFSNAIPWDDSEAFNGVEIYNLNDDSGFPLSDVSVDTNDPGWTSSQISFSDDAIWLDFGLSVDAILSQGHPIPPPWYWIDLQFAPVPIPGAVWLLGSGLIGIVGVRKKFKR